MLNGLVSIISPCYNKAPYIERFVRSVIDQDYRPIELIVVDDGSSDNSWSVLNYLKKDCEAAGIVTIFFRQANKGVGYAINACLKMVHGEYLCWPDCDDWLDKMSVSKRVHFLQNNRQYGIVTSNAYIYRDPDTDKPIGLIANEKSRFREQQYELMLNGKSIVCAGCHMVRTEALFKAIGDNQIYPSRFGQNLQLLFPILYHSPRGFIDEPLYNCVIYDNSLSHYERSFEKVMEHREGRFDIKVNTIKKIPGMSERDRMKSLRVIKVNEYRYRLEIARNYADLTLAKIQLTGLLKNKSLTPRDMFIALSIRKAQHKNV